MQRILLVITACCCMVFGNIAIARTIKNGELEVKIGDVATWVEPIEVTELSHRRNEGPVRYRLFDRQVRFGEEADEYFQDFASQALNQQGVKELSKIELNFNPAFEKLTLHQLQVQRDGKWVDRLESARISVINQEPELSNDLFHGMATAVVIVDDVRIGDSVRYQFSIQGRNPVYEKNFAGQFSMGWTTAVDLVRLRVINQSKSEMKVESPSDFTYSTAKTPWGDEYIWEKEKSPKYTYEEGMPPGYIWEPRVFISNAKNWRSIGEWAIQHYVAAEPDSKELAQYIEQLKAQPVSLKQKVSQAINFVQQDIRYFGVEIGQNSHIPHTPSQVFERRYGDCKDKANLLKRILTQLGVTTYPALVNTQIGDALHSRQPSAQSFNHVINFIELDGKTYWVDGTNNAQAFGIDSITSPDFGYALILSPEVETLSEMQKGDPDLDRIAINQEFVSPNYGEGVDLYITTSYFGKEADYMRYRLASVQHSEVEQHYLNYYARFYSDIVAITPLKVVDENDHKNKVTMLEHYRLGDFWKKVGNNYGFYVYAGEIANFTNLPKVLRRKHPLASYQPVSVEQRIKVTLPENINYAVREKPTKFEGVNLDYTSTESYNYGVFSRHQTMVLKTKSIPEKQTREYLKALRNINDDLGYEGSINGDFSSPINSGVSHLEQLGGAYYE